MRNKQVIPRLSKLEHLAAVSCAFVPNEHNLPSVVLVQLSEAITEEVLGEHCKEKVKLLLEEKTEKQAAVLKEVKVALPLEEFAVAHRRSADSRSRHMDTEKKIVNIRF